MNAYELKTKAQTIKAGFCLYCSARPSCHVVPWKRYSPVAFVVCLILGYLKIECLYLLFTGTMMSNYACRDIRDFVSLPQCIYCLLIQNVLLIWFLFPFHSQLSLAPTFGVCWWKLKEHWVTKKSISIFGFFFSSSYKDSYAHQIFYT